QVSCGHRDPHSLPTRRSSDLRLLLGQPDRSVLEPLFAELEFRTLGKRVFGEEFNVLTAQSSSGAQMDLFGNAAEPNTGNDNPSKDRKSTRLNSSHVKTSYAVC